MHPSQHSKFPPQRRSQLSLELLLLQSESGILELLFGTDLLLLQPLLPKCFSMQTACPLSSLLLFSGRRCCSSSAGNLCYTPLLLHLQQKVGKKHVEQGS